MTRQSKGITMRFEKGHDYVKKVPVEFKPIDEDNGIVAILLTPKRTGDIFYFELWSNGGCKECLAYWNNEINRLFYRDGLKKEWLDIIKQSVKEIIEHPITIKLEKIRADNSDYSKLNFTFDRFVLGHISYHFSNWFF